MDNNLNKRDQLIEEIKELSEKLSQFEKNESDQRIIEEALILQKTWFEQLFKNISHGIAILDPNDRILNINDAFEKIFNYSLDEVWGKKLNEVIVPEELFDEGTNLSQTTFNGNIADKYTVRKRRDGSLVNVRILGVPIHINGIVKSIFAIYEDITERKIAEESRIQAAELKIQAAELHAQVSESQALAAEAQSRAIQAENNRKTNELEEARKLQLSMLPKSIPILSNVEIAVYMKTAAEVGGDYYDHQITKDGKLLIVIGDATGHGLKAGTMVTIIKSLFYSEAENMDIIPFFNKCTNTIKKMQISNLFMGLTIAKINKNDMVLSSAGMPPVYHYIAKKKEVEKILFKGMPLGAFSNFSYDERTVHLEKGDTILFLTDGLPELFNDDDDILDYHRLENLFNKVGDESPKIIIEKFVNFGEEWNKGGRQTDDITFIVLKVKK